MGGCRVEALGADPHCPRLEGGVGAGVPCDGHRAAAERCAFVAQRAAETGYLCGSGFSIADLTAASTLAVFVRPDASPMAAPQPLGRKFQALVDRCASHPGADRVRRIYAQHRASRSDFDGASPGAG